MWFIDFSGTSARGVLSERALACIAVTAEYISLSDTRSKQIFKNLCLIAHYVLNCCY